MVVDELVEDGDNLGDNLYNNEGTVNTQEEGGNVEDTVMEEENKGNQTPVPDDDEGSEPNPCHSNYCSYSNERSFDK